MKCKRCGRENPNDVIRCMHCNTPFYGENSNINMPQNEQKQPVSSKKSKKNNKASIAVIMAIGALVLILVSLIGVYACQSCSGGRGFGIGGGGGGGSISAPAETEDNGAFVLEASKHELEVGASDNVIYFYATPKQNATKVELTDDEGKVIMEMKDDGAYSESGDDIANDGVYTAKLTIDVAQEQVFYYSARLNSDKEAMSNVEKITVIAKLTQPELAAINKVNTLLKNMRESDSYKNLSVDERSKVALENINQLCQEGLIDAESILEDKEANTISFYYTSGVMGMERLEDVTPVYAGNKKKNGASEKIDANMTSFAKNTQGTQTNIKADLGDALILYAWGDPNDAEWKPYYNACSGYKQIWTDSGLNTTLDSDVTIKDLKSIKDKSFVYIAAHGLYTKYKYEYDIQKWFVFKTDSKKTVVTAPAVFFLEKATDSKNLNYSSDLKTGRIVICNGEYGIVPAFFDEYYDSDDLENTIMFWGSCQFMGKNGAEVNDWTTTLISKSVKAFIGFHNSNYIAYHCGLLNIIVPALVEGKTIDEALTAGMDEYGSNDAEWYNMTHEDTLWDDIKQWFTGDEHPHENAAYPVLKGDKNATLINNNLINGKFEASSISIKGWKKTGDVRLLTKLGEVAPQEGSQMTILTTGIGSGQSSYLNSTEGSCLYQSIKLSNKLKLSFDYNIISEEPTEFVGSKYDDQFYAEILNSDGVVVKTIASETVNESEWAPVKKIDFDGGDSTVYQTGWKKVECDLSDLKDQVITIRFIVFDVGDSIYDTAAVIDNVVLQ